MRDDDEILSFLKQNDDADSRFFEQKKRHQKVSSKNIHIEREAKIHHRTTEHATLLLPPLQIIAAFVQKKKKFGGDSRFFR